MKYRDKEWLQEQIKIHGANGRQIALANNYSPVTVQRYMKKFDLYEIKEKKQHEIVVKKEAPLYQDKEWLQQQFDLYSTVTEVSRQTGYPRTCITRYAQRFEIYISKFNRQPVNTVNENYFKHIDTEDKAYWLGFFMADANMYIFEDGRIQFAIKIKNTDHAHLEKLKQAISFSGDVKQGCNMRNNTECYFSEIKIYNKVFCENLMKHGIVPHKTGQEILPDTIPEDLKKHFIRGFVDGDGWVIGVMEKYKRAGIGICSTNETICNQIFDHIKQTVGIEMKKYLHSNMYRLVTYSREQVYMIVKYLYKDANIYLDRKNKTATVMMLQYEANFQ